MTQAYNLSQLANKVNTSGQIDVTSGLTGATPVANGGTGQTTYTNGQLLIGNTTGNTLTKATITAGTGISVTNGGGSITIASTVTSGQLQYALYASGTSTWTCPADVTKVKVICIGGGGGGGQAVSGEPDIVGGTGGYGGIAIGIYTVSPGTGYSVVVGAGGAGSNSAGGSSGGSSSFGSTICSATGGDGANNLGNDGASGVGSGGITTNSNVIYGAGGVFSGPSFRARAVSSTAAITWSASQIAIPGAGGQGEIYDNSNAAGGVGGVVYIEYIG